MGGEQRLGEDVVEREDEERGDEGLVDGLNGQSAAGQKVTDAGSIPDELQVTVDELRVQDRKQWPLTEEMAHRSGGAQRRTNVRAIRGAKHYIEYPGNPDTRGSLAASGNVPLADGTEIGWYLWKGERPNIHSYAARGGYVAALYENELFDVIQHHAVYRSFGVTESSVRSRLWLIVRPEKLSDGRGVYARGDRNSLLIQGGALAGEPLPMADWGAQFSEKMPDEIHDALKAARAGTSGTLTDDTWRERLAERFGSRWRVSRLLANKSGKSTANATQAGSLPRAAKPKTRGPSRRPSGGAGGTRGTPTIGAVKGPAPASQSNVAGGIPTYEFVRSDDVAEGMMAAWAPNHPDHPEGAVLINVEHPVIEEQIGHWQSQYPTHLDEVVRDEVLKVYGEIAVAKVAHSEHLKQYVPKNTVEVDLRSEQALTMALLGLISEDAIIATRVGGKLGKLRRRAA